MTREADYKNPYRVGILCTHPVQYYVPWYRGLASLTELDLTVYYCHRQTPAGQAEAGFGTEFEWDIPLFEGYRHEFLGNVSKNPGTSGYRGCDTPEISDIISEGGFDAFIVQGWYAKSMWQAITACWSSRTPVLVRGDSHLLTERSMLKRLAKYPVYRWFIPRFDAYLVVGKLSAAYFEHYGASREKMFFVPHCVDNDFFGSKSDGTARPKEDARRFCGVPGDGLVVIFVGKLTKWKRPGDFLMALGRVADSRDNVCGLVVGDGPLRAELEAQAKSAGISVAFTGFLNQTELRWAYSASDVLVLPSDETWGLVVNEAMASGLPAIVSDRVGCGPDLVRPGETGAVYPLGDVSALAGEIERFATDPGLARAMGEGARGLVAGYSVRKAVEGTLAAIMSVGVKKS